MSFYFLTIMIIVLVKRIGVLMEEWHLLARAVLVLDSQNTVQYTEYLENINESPNYEKPVGVVKSL